MHEPPDEVEDVDVLRTVRCEWRVDAGSAEHLPVGFGAHHWRVGSLFVTLDSLAPHHTADSLEGAYAGAASLGLDFVVAALPSVSGSRTVPFAGGALSATPWVDGTRPAGPAGALPLVHRLHAVEPPSGVPTWQPLVPATYAEGLAERLRRPWSAGPLAVVAHRVLDEHRHDVARWTADYHRLAEVARSRPWVATHGEPHERNQLLTPDGLRLVDWESLKRAPAERDLRWLGAPDADPAMVSMFDLEWRLDEIAQYADRFEAAHTGTADDRTALEGLRHELTRS